ncbi:nucleotidyltransferase family protein [Vibrio maritimus]|uniref:nucleotidyltransferase family protein n=1 Tax=Vibrio maritimus TaxID=990268 RepID=UPI00406975FC
MNRLIQLIENDSARLEAIHQVYLLALPQCYLAAGFVRNLVWDHLHNKKDSTPLNDIDVVYFDPNETDDSTYLVYENMLRKIMPQYHWQVRNQAIMHARNGDAPYTSTLDAMSYWPEKETAVGIRQVAFGQFECISAFGFESLFQAKLSPNPKRPLRVFHKRVESKQWLTQWPLLTVVEPN